MTSCDITSTSLWTSTHMVNPVTEKLIGQLLNSSNSKMAGKEKTLFGDNFAIFLYFQLSRLLQECLWIEHLDRHHTVWGQLFQNMVQFLFHLCPFTRLPSQHLQHKVEDTWSIDWMKRLHRQPNEPLCQPTHMYMHTHTHTHTQVLRICLTSSCLLRNRISLVNLLCMASVFIGRASVSRNAST